MSAAVRDRSLVFHVQQSPRISLSLYLVRVQKSGVRRVRLRRLQQSA